MKRIYKLLLSLLLALSCTTGICTHVHDENCGYNPETKTGCTHKCEENIDLQGKWDPSC